MVEQWNRDRGTLEVLMVEQWNRGCGTVEQQLCKSGTEMEQRSGNTGRSNG